MKRRSLVFNELSISRDNDTNLFATLEDALKYMEEFVLILKEADKRNFNLRVLEGFHHFWLWKNFTIRDWAFDEKHNVDRELQEFFLQTLDILEPYNKNISEKLYAKLADGFIAYYDNMEAQGLGYAFFLNAIAISLNSSLWDKSIIAINWLHNDKSSDESPDESVRHTSTLSHLDEHHPLRIYENNPKHPPAGEERYTAIMDLSLDEATDTLLNGVMIEGTNRIFGYYNRSFYVFPNHLENKYHGYKVKEFPQVIRKKVLQALRDEEIIDEIIYNQHIK